MDMVQGERGVRPLSRDTIHRSVNHSSSFKVDENRYLTVHLHHKEQVNLFLFIFFLLLCPF